MFSNEQLQRFYQYCVVMTHDAETARELLHESLEKYLTKKRNDLANPSAYFRKIIRHTFIDERRKQQREAVIGLDPDNLISLEEPSLEQLYLNRLELEKLLATLHYEDRELLYLCCVEGYTVQALADAWGCPKGTLLSKLHRLKKRIRQEFDQHSGGGLEKSNP